MTSSRATQVAKFMRLHSTSARMPFTSAADQGGLTRGFIVQVAPAPANAVRSPYWTALA